MTGNAGVVASRAAPGGNQSRWVLPDDFVITRAGSLVRDWAWDLSADGDRLGRVTWDAEVSLDGFVVGRLSDPEYAPLMDALKKAVAIRWRFRRPEEGRAWHSIRVGKAIDASRRFALFAAAIGVRHPLDITEEVFLAYVEDVLNLSNGRKRTKADAATLIDAPLLLWRLRHRIPTSLGFVPETDNARDWARDGADSKPIPLIPKVVLDHVIGAALRYVEVFANDILAANALLTELSANYLEQQGIAEQPKRGTRAYSAQRTWVQRRMGWQDKSGWSPAGGFAIDPETGTAWLENLYSGHQLTRLTAVLCTSCYVVIAFMTAARISEMKRLRVGAERHIQRTDGRSDEFEIDGIVIKHQGDDGRPVTWSVPEPAYRAAGVLTTLLQTARTRTGSDRLVHSRRGGPASDSVLADDLRIFCEHVGVPYVNGKPYPVTTHVLRVAMAQWLGLEPYGELAGAFHLNHLSTTVFRGYLRDNPEFQSLFESYGLIAQADHLAALMEEPVLLGRKGAQIMASRSPEEQLDLEQRVRAMDLAQVGREAPPKRTLERMAKAGIPVYRTRFTSCMFRADSAECLRDVPLEERVAPRTHACSPESCANSAMTRLAVPAYLEDFEAYAAMRDDPAQSPSQRELAIDEMVKLTGLIEPFIPTLTAERDVLIRDLVGKDEREVETIAMSKRLAVVENLLERISSGGVLGMARGH